MKINDAEHWRDFHVFTVAICILSVRCMLKSFTHILLGCSKCYYWSMSLFLITNIFSDYGSYFSIPLHTSYFFTEYQISQVSVYCHCDTRTGSCKNFLCQLARSHPSQYRGLEGHEWCLPGSCGSFAKFLQVPSLQHSIPTALGIIQLTAFWWLSPAHRIPPHSWADQYSAKDLTGLCRHLGSLPVQFPPLQHSAPYDFCFSLLKTLS